MKLSMLPPPGYKPGQTRAPLISDIAVPLTVVAVTVACLRFYVRARLVRVMGKDDWLLLTAVIFLCCYVGTALLAVHLTGLGKHQYEVFQNFDPNKTKFVRYSYAPIACLQPFHPSCCLLNWY